MQVRGLYRIRRQGEAGLLYIGQGVIAHRLTAHLAKPGNQRYARQADHFTGSLDYSWVGNQDWREHERLELENDLIAAYVLATGEVPAAQFLG